MKQLLCLLLLSAFRLPLSALAEAVPPPVPAIAVRMVHPDNQKLAGKGKPAPEGYTACVHEFRGNDGKMKRTRLFVKDAPVITEADVERAQADPGNPGQINITLNTRGGRAMKETTSAMKLGHDRLAVLVHGRVTTAPVVMAILSNTFTVSGLDGENEAENLAELLNRKAAAGKATSFTPRDLALYAVHPDSGRLVKEGTLSVPGYRLWSRPGAEEGKNAEKEYLFLGNAPIVTGDYAQSARPNLDYPGHLNIVWNEEGARKLEQACAALRPGRDRIAVVLRGAILSTPVLHGAPSHATLIPVPGDDRQLDGLCTAINNQLPPLTEQQQREAKKELAIYPVHPRSAELEQRFLPELRRGRTIHLKSGFRSIPYNRPGFPEPVPAWAFIRTESLIAPEDVRYASREQDGTITCGLLPRAWKKLRSFMDGSPAGNVAVAIAFRGRVHQVFNIRNSLWQMWGIPLVTSIQPVSVICILTPEEERRMDRELLYFILRDMLSPACPWFFKNCVPFRTLGEQKPFLMIDSGLDRP